MATLIQEIIVKLKCLEYLAMRLKSMFKKGNFQQPTSFLLLFKNDHVYTK